MKMVRLVDGPMGNAGKPIIWPDNVEWPDYAWFGATKDGKVMISLGENAELHRYKKIGQSILDDNHPRVWPGATYEYAPDGIA